MGAIPSPQTILGGMNDVSAQLLAMGLGGPSESPGDVAFQGLLPNHKGIYPPTDRLSVFTYWYIDLLQIIFFCVTSGPNPAGDINWCYQNLRFNIYHAESIANVIIYILASRFRHRCPRDFTVHQVLHDSEWGFTQPKACRFAVYF
ncbi:uncharacterized protein EI90DRAFT_297170 [Cantharellus anzutake]|uniref:uncharacterized protein n=1 Tax=Cantharellus anzutake TaxID=1750568 RepID=UPI001904AB8F|nr:uncharacterized protein EI90DRAFT_297170 [Cantharellus anzutake]KAF8315979.1 hypothetical protein EI90DRAFT_297170 [Cantharellus anzutake]